MENEKIVVGLDIGTTKICAIVGRKNEFGKLEVLGMGKAESEGVIKGIVTNIEKTVFAIGKAIKEASDMSGIDIGVVMWALRVSTYAVRYIMVALLVHPMMMK